MGSFWIKDGKIVMEGGKFIVCDECPCDENDCYADVIAAIRERQAIGSGTVWDAEPSPPMTLSQCITITNFLALKFIAGTYSGGASPPTMRTNSYATGAADFCVLYDLLCALRSTYVPFTATFTGDGQFKFVTPGAIPRWEAHVSDYREFSELIPIAQSQWARITYAGTSGDYARASLALDGSLRRVDADLNIQKMRLADFPTTISKSARIFLKTEAYNNYNYSGLGYHSLAQGSYSLIESVSMGPSDTINLSPWPCSEPAPWPPGMPSSGPWSGGYEIASRFAIIDWGFAHT